MKKIGFMFAALLGVVAQPAFADILGVANGRSANMDNMAAMSVEGGLSLEGDLSTYGARINYKLNPDVMLFGDIGMHKQDFGFGSDADGIVFGVGAYYQMRNVTLLENTDFALKGSYHTGSIEVGDCNSAFFSCDVDVSELTLEALISGDQLSTTAFGWYANAGMHILGVKVEGFDDSSNELGFGGGITGQISAGEWYAGVDLIDELFLRAGFRYNLN